VLDVGKDDQLDIDRRLSIIVDMVGTHGAVLTAVRAVQIALKKERLDAFHARDTRIKTTNDTLPRLL
jgi:hypothetical protein